jgi:hypothetical protein
VLEQVKPPTFALAEFVKLKRDTRRRCVLSWRRGFSGGLLIFSEKRAALIVKTAACLRGPVGHLAYSFPYLLPRGMARNLKARSLQPKLLAENYSPDCKRLIVFLTPGHDEANGGIMSISSIYAETKKLKRIHGAEAIMCTIPGDPRLLRYTKFANDNYIFTFSQMLSYFRNLESMLIHVPTYCVDQFLRKCSREDQSALKRVRGLHVNMMIQSITALASDRSITRLGQLGKLTGTTAYEQDATLELSRRLGCPLYKLSWFLTPELYQMKSYAEKEDLIIVSPDDRPRKEEILRTIAKECPQIRLALIKNMPYEKYKELITRAKWSLTFGGLDGYFVETIFSGGIGFSVYNDFFTEDFSHLRTVYAGYDDMARRICHDVKSLDNKESYANYHREQYELCSKHFDRRDYVSNLAAFYRSEFLRA